MSLPKWATAISEALYGFVGSADCDPQKGQGKLAPRQLDCPVQELGFIYRETNANREIPQFWNVQIARERLHLGPQNQDVTKAPRHKKLAQGSARRPPFLAKLCTIL
jgi:hypothetical protein